MLSLSSVTALLECVCVCVCVCVHVCIPYSLLSLAIDQWWANHHSNGSDMQGTLACGSLVKMTFTAIFIDIHECAAQLLQSNTNVVIYHAKRTLKKGSDIVHKLLGLHRVAATANTYTA